MTTPPPSLTADERCDSQTGNALISGTLFTVWQTWFLVTNVFGTLALLADDTPDKVFIIRLTPLIPTSVSLPHCDAGMWPAVVLLPALPQMHIFLF